MKKKKRKEIESKWKQTRLKPPLFEFSYLDFDFKLKKMYFICARDDFEEIFGRKMIYISVCAAWMGWNGEKNEEKE